jgi:hypothetical protein
MCEGLLLQCSKSPNLRCNENKPNGETPWDSPVKRSQTMALVTAYLARTAQRSAGRTTVGAARNLLGFLAAFVREASSALSEARELRRAMTAKYPFTDI